MKTQMNVKANATETKAMIQISTVYKGIDKMKEFSEIKRMFSDSEKIGMKWNNNTGEYEAEIDLTPENAEPFVKYAESKNIEIVM